MKITRQQGVLISLKIVIVITNCLLALQYMLGMIVNLFDNIPFDQIDVKNGSFLEKTGIAFGYARTSPILALQLHWLNACQNEKTSIMLVILGVKAHQKMVWILALLLSLIFSVATVSGAAFIAYGGSNYYSFSMATAFIIASFLAVFLLLSIFSKRMVKTQTDQGLQERVERMTSGEMANR